jgi:hypothetical protein
MLREAKQKLEPVLLADGLVFHGLAIRRPRRRRMAVLRSRVPDPHDQSRRTFDDDSI